MSLDETAEIACPECGDAREVALVHAVNASLEPEGREALLEGRLNQFLCESCGFQARLPIPLFYHDMDLQYCAHYFPFEAVDDAEALSNFNADGSMDIQPPEGMPFLSYVSEPHVVFSMEDLVRYVVFRERLATLYDGNGHVH